MGETYRVGLVAGRGDLPLNVIREIRARGGTPVVVGLKPEASVEVETEAEVFLSCFPGELEATIDFLREHQVREVVFAGKVGKEALFTGKFDPKLQRLLAALPVKNDDAILLAIVEEFENNGLPVARQTDYLQQILAKPGVLCGGEPTPAEERDLSLGFSMAKAIGKLDIGQSVVVKQGVILAVEAMEGTDRAIRRGGELGGQGAVVVKVSKPSQDERFDVPTVGLATLEAMSEVKASVLGIEAEKTLIAAAWKDFLAMAERFQIKVIAI